MYKQVEKSKENQSRAVVDSVVQEKVAGSKVLGLSIIVLRKSSKG